MSRIGKEIFQAMSGLEACGENSLKAVFAFPLSFVGFQGHFENNPVLPGICKIRAVLTMMNAFHGKTIYRLKEVAQAKYTAPVTAGQLIRAACQWKTQSDGTETVKAEIFCGETRSAQLKLVVEKAEEPA